MSEHGRRERSSLHCDECGTSLSDGEMLRGASLCLSCQEEDDRLYGPEEDHDYCPRCGEAWCCEDTHA